MSTFSQTNTNQSTEKEKNFQIEDLSSLHRYRTEIPNILLDMELTPFELSLYLHIKRMAGDKGICFAKNSLLCKKLGVCDKTIRNLKKSLEKKNLIKVTKRINPDKSKDSDLVQIVDLWPQNFEHFKSRGPVPDTGGVRYQIPGGPVPDTDKEELYKKEPIKEVNARARDSSTSKKKEKKKKICGYDNIYLTDKEFKKLEEKYSYEDRVKIFDKLSAYKKESGKIYPSDYGAITHWVADWLKNEKSMSKATERRIEENRKWAEKFDKDLETRQVRGNFRCYQDGVCDNILNKECLYSNMKFKEIINSWY